jgi:hypothetical protein
MALEKPRESQSSFCETHVKNPDTPAGEHHAAMKNTKQI